AVGGAPGLPGSGRHVEADGPGAALGVVGQGAVAPAGPGRRRAAPPGGEHEGALVLGHPVAGGEGVDASGVLAEAVAGGARLAEADDRVAELAGRLEAGDADHVVLARTESVDHALDAN